MVGTSSIKALAFAVVAALALTACGNNDEAKQPVEEQQPAAAPVYIVSSLNNGQFQQNGTTVTVSRESPQYQGVSIKPVNPDAEEAAVMLQFNVVGEAARVRAYQGQQWIDVPGAAEYSIMFGRGGSSHIQVIPGRGRSATVTITGSPTCSSLPAGCTSLPTTN